MLLLWVVLFAINVYKVIQFMILGCNTNVTVGGMI